MAVTEDQPLRTVRLRHPASDVVAGLGAEADGRGQLVLDIAGGRVDVTAHPGPERMSALFVGEPFGAAIDANFVAQAIARAQVGAVPPCLG